MIAQRVTKRGPFFAIDTEDLACHGRVLRATNATTGTGKAASKSSV